MYINSLAYKGDYRQIQYGYDRNGVRVSKTVNGTEHSYFTNGTQILSEKFGSTVLTYLYDGSGVIGLRKGSDYYYFLKNQQGDVKLIVDDAGNLQCRYVYDAWGNHKIFNSSNIDITENASYNTHIGRLNPFRYRGYYYDTESGFYYLNSRYYDPEVRRFINADDPLVPATEKATIFGGLNLYSYCLNNPVMYTDGTGRNEDDSFWMGLISSLEIIAGLVCLFIPGAQQFALPLLGGGIGSLVGGLANELSGGSFFAGWIGGQITGIISGLPFSGVAAQLGFVGGFFGSMATGLIDKIGYGRDISYTTIFTSSLVAGVAGSVFSVAIPEFGFGVSTQSIWYDAARFGYLVYVVAVSSSRGFLASAVSGFWPNIPDPIIKIGVLDETIR